MYGIEYKKPLKCGIHKGDFVDVQHDRCIEEGCSKNPTFNYSGEKKGIYCGRHKKDDMQDVLSKRCQENGCNTLKPSFNYSDKKIGIYCAKHKKENMFDVLHGTCLDKECNSLSPCFNLPGKKKGIYCIKHKTDLMIDIRHPKCDFEGCERRPSYNIVGSKQPLFCVKHKFDDMEDIISNYCKNNCGIRSPAENNKYKGYCARCFASNFPDEPMARNIKTKERAVVEFIMKLYPKHKWIFDKRVKEGSSMRRPDVILDMGNYVLIIEIDENQHIYYDCSCSNRRLMELSIDVNHMPMVVLRFNPDKYYNIDGKKIPSCWSIIKETGLLELSNKEMWNNRLEILKEQIDYWLINQTEKTVEVIELFYDQNLVI
jgi:hypothetical protein